MQNCTFNLNGTDYGVTGNSTNICHNYTSINDGNYTLNATCYDWNNNSASVGSSWVKVDTVDPTVSWNWSDRNTRTFYNSTNVSVSVDEEALWCNLTVNGTVYAMTGNASSTGWWQNLTNFSDDTYSVSVTCSDLAGNTDTLSGSWWQVLAQPDLTITKNASNIALINTLFNYTITVNNSGTKLYNVTISDALNTTCVEFVSSSIVNATPGVWNLSDINPGAASTLIITVRASTNCTFNNTAILNATTYSGVDVSESSLAEVTIKANGVYGGPDDVNTSDDVIVNIGGNNITGTTNITGVQNVIITDTDTDAVIEFEHNFTNSTLYLSQITIISTNTYTIVRMSGQLQSGQTKNITVADNSFVSLCVKDANVVSIGDVSNRCNGAGETSFTNCLGKGTLVSRNGLTCIDHGNTIEIGNLTHSAVKGTRSSSNNDDDDDNSNSGSGKIIGTYFAPSSTTQLPPPQEPPQNNPPESPEKNIPTEEPKTGEETKETEIKTVSPPIEKPLQNPTEDFSWIYLIVIAAVILILILYLMPQDKKFSLNR
jgi:hypothetical protein